jgi:hypothetical protein
MVERQDIAALGEPLQRGQVALVTDIDTGDDLRGTIVGIASQDAQRDPKPDGGGHHHACELPAAHDSDDGKAHASTLAHWRG